MKKILGIAIAATAALSVGCAADTTDESVGEASEQAIQPASSSDAAFAGIPIPADVMGEADDRPDLEGPNLRFAGTTPFVEVLANGRLERVYVGGSVRVHCSQDTLDLRYFYTNSGSDTVGGFYNQINFAGGVAPPAVVEPPFAAATSPSTVRAKTATVAIRARVPNGLPLPLAIALDSTGRITESNEADNKLQITVVRYGFCPIPLPPPPAPPPR